MCGIFGIFSRKKRPIDGEILTGLKTLEYRGYDSWGLAVLAGDKIKIRKEVGKIGGVEITHPTQSTVGIGHTRWATHGGVTKANAHPHLSYDGRFALVHNGIIENYLELKAELLKILPQLHFKSQTDSEVLVHYLAYEASRLPLKEAWMTTLKRLKGLSAVVVLDQKTGQLLAYKNGSPLVVGIKNQDWYFASDALAFIPHTNQVYFLRDQETVINGQLYDLGTGTSRSLKTIRLKLDQEALTKDGYDFFMEKEIHETPQVISKLLATYAVESEPLLDQIRHHLAVALIGCGSAYYASLVGQYLLATAGVVATAYSGGEAGHFLSNLPATTLPIFLSQSGETIDLLEQVTWLKKQGRSVVALVNRLSSTLDREADVSFHLQAGPEISVVSTKVLIAKITTWLLVVGSLTETEAQIRRQLESARSAIKKLFSQTQQGRLTKIAQILADQPRGFVLGRGQNYPIALEMALKAKEAAYLHLEGFAGGELKHGVIALIEPGTWCLVLVGGDDEDQNMLANAQEIKARGGKILGLAPINHPVFDEWLPYADCGRANVVVETVLCHLLGLSLARAKGLDPDMPRNLAKSVTVK